MNEMTAWEEAACGHLSRLVKVYGGTMRRAAARRLLPTAMVYGLTDEGWTMLVKHAAMEGSGFFPCRMLAPGRDGVLGFMVQTPTAFKAALRAYIANREGETLQ